MTSGHFVTVFDIGSSGFKDWDFPAFGLIFVAVGLVFLFAPVVIRALGIPFRDFGSWRFALFRYGLLGFALFWTVLSFGMTYTAYAHHAAMARENRCTMVEGPIEDFVPMPYEGHANESFTVSGVPFAYSDYGVSDTFNTTASHGGPIRAGQVVRICYDPANNAILRFAIRDYRGPIPDYSRALDFPAPPSKSDDAIAMPWYASLFVYIYFLSFAGIFLLYRPYLRTFFRLATVTVSAPVNPSLLAGHETVKLKDTLARWDEEQSAIWLRPRGFNLFQVSLVVAKLKIDVTTARVSSYEIRLASGLPVFMIAFFASALGLFSQVLPVPAAAGIIGAFAVIATLGNWPMMTRLRNNMETLVDEALPEFRDAR